MGNHFFRPGDRVRVIDGSDSRYRNGSIGSVIEPGSHTGGIVWVQADDYEMAQVFSHEQLHLLAAALAHKPALSPLAQKVRTFLRTYNRITAMDAMRALGLSSGSLTRRLTELRQDGEVITHSTKVDPITQRRYGVWTLDRMGNTKQKAAA